ncbi:Zinc finger CCHC domain-containing protein 3 [Holothuria leucospilota]|uniref:Zinc finger CCHC domain-containing protein 3 n=1 Tax=Holothuria leucospilota TaxID=206669 RepID=A0A9Q1HKH6_HOLLE|nr:Zinc finger CCHC domain-containing protein 3 [Holothuria leucospilota]
MRWVTYQEGELKGILNGKRQFRMVLKREIPSFIFIGGSKAHIRYFGQPRTCFKCSEEGHEAKSCPNRRCGKCLQVGHEKAECPNEVRCNLCGGGRDMFLVPAPLRTLPVPVRMWGRHMNPRSQAQNLWWRNLGPLHLMRWHIRWSRISLLLNNVKGSLGPLRQALHRPPLQHLGRLDY